MGAEDDDSMPLTAPVSWTASMANLNNLGGAAAADRLRRGVEASGGGEASGRGAARQGGGSDSAGGVTITVASGQALKHIKAYGQLMR